MWHKIVKGSALFALVLFFWLSAQATAGAAPLTAQTTRLYGPTRIETAIRISQTGWQQADTVLLARADDFPDSLVAVPLSRRLDAPVLLTYPDKLEPAVLEEIKRLRARHVILLGGPGVLGQRITQPLEKANLTWERIGGKDRFDTAVQVAERLGGNGQVILVNGDNFPDALAIGPYAGITETPILLTSAKTLPKVTKDELEKFGAYKPEFNEEVQTKTYVIGGEGVVTSEVIKGLTSVKRIAGKDRYETAAKVYWFAQEELSTIGLTEQTQAYLVTGENFPDALVAGALAVKQNALLFMSEKNSLPAMTYSAMGNAANNKLSVTIIGSGAVVSDQVKGTVEGTIQPPYLLGGVTVVVDPGHGGKDTGAIGATGTYEKNNTLSVGLYLADLLRAAGAKVILTRTSDTSVAKEYSSLNDLQERVNIAKQNKADLYVSIHNDSFTNPEAGGTTTYYSSENPQGEKSLKLGQAVQAEVVKQLNLQDRKVKDAALYVIKNATMPAVLIELGFISNPNEEKLLSSPEFQKKAALGIYRGILVYKGY